MRFLRSRTTAISAEQSRQLAAQLAAISESEIPLGSGLRSVAAELPAGKLRGAIDAAVQRLDRGESLDVVFEQLAQQMEPELHCLLLAAVRSGRVPEVLGQFVEQQRLARELWNAIRGALAYPALLLAMTMCVVVVFSIWVIPDLCSSIGMFTWGMVRDSTEARISLLQWWSGTGVYYMLVSVGIGVVMLVGLRLAIGAARWQRLKSSIPLLGPIYQWISVVEWSRMTGLLLSSEVPLSEAVVSASAGSSNPDWRRYGGELAAGVEQGQSLSNLLETRRSLSGTCAMLVRWGEQADALPSALETVADYFEDRARLRIAFLRSVVPPTVFVCVAAVGCLLMGLLFATMLVAMQQVAWVW